MYERPLRNVLDNLPLSSTICYWGSRNISSLGLGPAQASDMRLCQLKFNNGTVSVKFSGTPLFLKRYRVSRIWEMEKETPK